MKITNQLGLPPPLVRAVSIERQPHPPMTVSVTELIRPAQITGLRNSGQGELVEDASDRLWSLMGTLLHDVLERHAKNTDDVVAEERLSIQIGKWTITGQYDLSEFILEGEILDDWKFTSIYSLRENEPVKPEWEAQVNCYAELLRQAGRSVAKARIIAIGRDWSKMRASRESDYPQKAVTIKDVPLWTSAECVQYIEHRLYLYETALKGEWPECDEEERWARPTRYALMKKGNKKATKLYDTYDAAERNRGAAYYIQTRPGESVRCEHYCDVATVCPQWARLNQNNTTPKGDLKNERTTEEI